MDKKNYWFYDELKRMDNGEGTTEIAVCPVCKTERTDFVETMFVGCPNCYTVFADEIEKMIENYHGATEHVGKVPEKVVNTESIKREIERITKLKNDAVLNEDYLLADSYLQKLKKLRGGEL